MTFRGGIFAGSALALLLAGCSHEFDPPDRGARVLEAEAAYNAAMFDSVTWVSDSVRAVEGNTVYAEMCRRCHGPLGFGDTDYARERGLEIPSLVEPGWALANLDTLATWSSSATRKGCPSSGPAESRRGTSMGRRTTSSRSSGPTPLPRTAVERQGFPYTTSGAPPTARYLQISA